MSHTETVNLPHEQLAAAVEEARGQAGDLTDQLIATHEWTDQMLADAGIPVVDVPLVSVGGGIGSFVLADYLRVAGMPMDRFIALGALDKPWDTYEYLTRVSQIPRPERLRSDSGSTPDNCWGVPVVRVPGVPRGEGLPGQVRPPLAGLHRTDLHRLLHPAGRPGVRVPRGRGQPHRLPRSGPPRASSAWCASVTAAATSRSSRPRPAPHPPNGWRTAAPTSTWPSATPDCASCPTCRPTGRPTRTTTGS